MTEKYMLTIQHEDQKVAYFEFTSSDDESAKKSAENKLSEYNEKKGFAPIYPFSGNFSGIKPAIKNTHVSKWIFSNTAQNAWNNFSGGYWKDI